MQSLLFTIAATPDSTTTGGTATTSEIHYLPSVIFYLMAMYSTNIRNESVLVKVLIDNSRFSLVAALRLIKFACFSADAHHHNGSR